ncbi:hypothetical protein P9600_gp04 [Escherichia phage vB_EcoD_Opt212]|uniref:Uncharacterized protein n=1 Tax=Escherichia phage vB_EcoD_Opt212 TaxID=2906743 RepID=A0AAE8Z6B8_9CAUD|nr:hypothetical protein P9600_gp04 [Escherichia phage vB_EcoD_Opt212]UHS64785.1 hypothetical protein OPT212_4 [Escherichia phage vB_EcoD_Opt212]
MAFKPQRDSRPMAERPRASQMEASFFRGLSFLTKKEQGKVMGEFRRVMAEFKQQDNS